MTTTGQDTHRAGVAAVMAALVAAGRGYRVEGHGEIVLDDLVTGRPCARLVVRAHRVAPALAQDPDEVPLDGAVGRAQADGLGALADVIVIGIELDDDLKVVAAGAVRADRYRNLVAAGRQSRQGRTLYPVGVRQMEPVSAHIAGVVLP